MEKTNKVFVPMYDLDRLSADELKQYYLDACAYHGVPPELNVLAFQYMDGGDGARRRVLYAKKGATDIIRERLGISVVQMEKEIFHGTLTYTCLGKNKDGRTEIAIGAAYIEGLTGRALEVAIMVAQTRATRRMTLQFAGAGLLDETELQADSKTTDIKEALTAPQPVKRPNAAPGKDITQNPPNEGVSLQEISEYGTTKTGENETPVEDPVFKRGPFGEMLPTTQNPCALKPSPAQLEALQALAKVPEPVLAKAAGETAQEAPKRRQRPKPVELDTPFSFDNPVSATTEKAVIPEKQDIAPVITPAIVVPKQVFEFLDTVQKATEAVTAALPTVIPELPNDGQMKTFRDRLFTYTNTILPQAGMVPSENIGGIGMKVRIFAQQKFGQVLNQLTVSQWEEMFKLFDGTSPAELVKLIDETAQKAKA